MIIRHQHNVYPHTAYFIHSLLHTAISTAALDMLAGETGTRMSRKPDIMADAAYLILSQNNRDLTGQFLIDDDVLRQHGVTDLDQYANVPGQFPYVSCMSILHQLQCTCTCTCILIITACVIEGTTCRRGCPVVFP